MISIEIKGVHIHIILLSSSFRDYDDFMIIKKFYIH